MTNIIDMLNERKDYLERIIEEKASLEEISSKKTGGKETRGKDKISKEQISKETREQNKTSITAIKHGKGFQYYRYNGKEKKYVPLKEIENVREIVQREYDTKILHASKTEYKSISKLLSIYDKITLDEIYESMPKGKRVLVNPIILPEEEYIKQWKEETYPPLEFRENAPEYYSSKGERMRSKSEVIIGNLLDRLHIEYKYEKPLRLKRLGIVHPDFTILDTKNRREIYWEHLGMLDDQVYRNNAILKIRAYEDSGYYVGENLIVTEETLSCTLDIKNIEHKIKHVLLKSE